MRVVLGCSHVDIFQALRLLLWIEYLGGHRIPITVVTTRVASGTPIFPKIQDLLENHFDDAKLFIERTSNESGWPASATHIFGESLHFSAGDAMLWLEPDAVPVKDNWFKALRDEYTVAGKPFLGRFIPAAKTHPDHMSGIAIYPRNWADYCPDLGKIDQAGMKAWDVDRAPSILPNMHRSELIQHRWVRHEKDRSVPLDAVSKGTVLFHQDKHHSLIRQLAEEFYAQRLTRDYLGDTSDSMTKYFLTDNARKEFNVGGLKIQFETAAILGGTHYGTLSANVDSDLFGALTALVAEGKVQEIDKAEFDAFEVKKKKFEPLKISFDLPNWTDSLLQNKAPTVALAEPPPPFANPQATTTLDDVLSITKVGKNK